jgi:hypothetical protein
MFKVSGKVSELNCQGWQMRYQREYAPTVVTTSVASPLSVFEEAVKAGARFNNPASSLTRKGPGKHLDLRAAKSFCGGSWERCGMPAHDSPGTARTLFGFSLTEACGWRIQRT